MQRLKFMHFRAHNNKEHDSITQGFCLLIFLLYKASPNIVLEDSVLLSKEIIPFFLPLIWRLNCEIRVFPGILVQAFVYGSMNFVPLVIHLHSYRSAVELTPFHLHLLPAWFINQTMLGWRGFILTLLSNTVPNIEQVLNMYLKKRRKQKKKKHMQGCPACQRC